MKKAAVNQNIDDLIENFSSNEDLSHLVEILKQVKKEFNSVSESKQNPSTTIKDVLEAFLVSYLEGPIAKQILETPGDFEHYYHLIKEVISSIS
ncbi:hypothetical protein [Phnomibacter sp. MR]|uniref:hypothetical protein n=1 Tax=Phnomibacter sp. MR TaxID=3042318 RepID=UPI003A80FCEC